MQLERRKEMQESRSTPTSVFHHRLTNPTDQPPNLRYPTVSYLAQGLEPISLDVGKLVETTFPATHRFLAKHAGLPIHNFVHVLRPYLPFVQQARENQGD